MNDLLLHDATAILEKALPIVEASQRILANNVANANTPGFTPARVSFRESLRQALGGEGASFSLTATHPRHITSRSAGTGLVLEPDTFEPGRTDQSTFDVDREMVELLKNSGRFDILSSMLTKRYQQLREVLRIP